MTTLVHLAVLTVAILALAKLLPDVRVRSVGAAVGVAIVFSVLNFFLSFVLELLIGAIVFIPAILTFGLLFLFVPLLVNAVLLWLTDRLMSSFEIRSGRGLAICALVITLVNAVLHARFLARG